MHPRPRKFTRCRAGFSAGIIIYPKVSENKDKNNLMQTRMFLGVAVTENNAKDYSLQNIMQPIQERSKDNKISEYLKIHSKGLHKGS